MEEPRLIKKIITQNNTKITFIETICNLLKQANLYSIEFTGIFNLKFSISQQSYYYNSIPDIIIQLNSGFLINNEKKEIPSITEDVFNLFDLSVINGILNIVFENNYSIESL